MRLAGSTTNLESMWPMLGRFFFRTMWKLISNVFSELVVTRNSSGATVKEH